MLSINYLTPGNLALVAVGAVALKLTWDQLSTVQKITVLISGGVIAYTFMNSKGKEGSFLSNNEVTSLVNKLQSSARTEQEFRTLLCYASINGEFDGYKNAIGLLPLEESKRTQEVVKRAQIVQTLHLKGCSFDVIVKISDPLREAMLKHPYGFFDSKKAQRFISFLNSPNNASKQEKIACRYKFFSQLLVMDPYGAIWRMSPETAPVETILKCMDSIEEKDEEDFAKGVSLGLDMQKFIKEPLLVQKAYIQAGRYALMPLFKNKLEEFKNLSLENQKKIINHFKLVFSSGFRSLDEALANLH